MPRCRTMMLPARHRWPPESFSPRYFGWAPPLLFEEPPAFFVALHVVRELTGPALIAPGHSWNVWPTMAGMNLPFKPVQTGYPSCRDIVLFAGVHTLVAGSSRQHYLSAQMLQILLHTAHEYSHWGARLQGTKGSGQELPYLLLAYCSVMPEERQLGELLASRLLDHWQARPAVRPA